jgi:hypothetical protein
MLRVSSNPRNAVPDAHFVLLRPGPNTGWLLAERPARNIGESIRSPTLCFVRVSRSRAKLNRLAKPWKTPKRIAPSQIPLRLGLRSPRGAPSVSRYGCRRADGELTSLNVPREEGWIHELDATARHPSGPWRQSDPQWRSCSCAKMWSKTILP